MYHDHCLGVGTIFKNKWKLFFFTFINVSELAFHLYAGIFHLDQEKIASTPFYFLEFLIRPIFR